MSRREKGNENDTVPVTDPKSGITLDLPVLFDINNYPEVRDGELAPDIPIEEFADSCREYFEEVSNLPHKAVKSQRGVVINQIPMPFTLDGLCLKLKITKPEFLAYSKRSPEAKRAVDLAIMMVNDHMVTQGLIGNYERQVVWNVIKNNDGFYKDKVIGEENTADNVAGGNSGNINLVVVNKKADLDKLKIDNDGKIVDIKKIDNDDAFDVKVSGK